MTTTPFTELPPELLLRIYESLDTLTDAHALADTCSSIRAAFTSHPSNLLYDTILRRTVPNYEDALRTVRAAATAFEYLFELGFQIESLQPFPRPSQESQQHSSANVERCYFDRVQGKYVGAPTTNFLASLGEKPLVSLWEARGVFALRALVSSWFQCIQTFGSGRPDCGIWFISADSSISGQAWSPAEEERFFRACYRFLLFGYLFSPGVFYEPLVLEREALRAFHVEFDGELIWDFADEYPDTMRKYPVYDPELTVKDREQHFSVVFGGFLEWLVQDGQRRGVEEDLQSYRSPLEYGGLWARPDREAWTPQERGGIRELVILHTISYFLGDFSSRLIRNERLHPQELRPTKQQWPICNWCIRGPEDGTTIMLWTIHPSSIPPRPHQASSSAPSPLPLSPRVLHSTHVIPTPFDLLTAFQDDDFPSTICTGHGLQPYYDAQFSHHFVDWGDYQASYEGSGGAILDRDWHALEWLENP
ncbi:hypothetical protein K432DRAFT_430338 [Lepidopterella palustris CBS 459.81]|uniref:F-box domain-containing protein n=1 Tax=Lepidopterella palustris CBS 459.81 TaxID=1314670 RepID=A0A8E2DYF1_9PEZI|nr:hypothetical protein K432DRAFT_430338 [Lepidopterella palustris CBS 459.81]